MEWPPNHPCHRVPGDKLQGAGSRVLPLENSPTPRSRAAPAVVHKDFGVGACPLFKFVPHLLLKCRFSKGRGCSAAVCVCRSVSREADGQSCFSCSHQHAAALTGLTSERNASFSDCFHFFLPVGSCSPELDQQHISVWKRRRCWSSHQGTGGRRRRRCLLQPPCEQGAQLLPQSTGLAVV